MYRYWRTILLVTTIWTIACNDATDSKGNASQPDSLAKPDTPAVAIDSPTVKGEGDISLPADSSLLLLTVRILEKFEKKQYAALADYFHPLEGIRFSPYGYVDTTQDQRIGRDQFLALLGNRSKRLWGTMDGSGDSIYVNIEGYFKRFVYDVKFLRPEKRSLNKFLGTGNSLNNLSKIYPGLPFTESYFSGFEKKYGGMDWRTLRIVFKKHEGKYYVVGVVHDQWTI